MKKTFPSMAGNVTSIWQDTDSGKVQEAFAFFPNDGSGTYIVDVLVSLCFFNVTQLLVTKGGFHMVDQHNDMAAATSYASGVGQVLLRRICVRAGPARGVDR